MSTVTLLSLWRHSWYSAVFDSTLMFQVSTPVELPTMTLAPQQEVPKMSKFTPPSTALKSLSINKNVPTAASPVGGSGSHPSSAAAEPPVNEADEELDELLGLHKPASGVAESPSVSGAHVESTDTEKCKYI